MLRRMTNLISEVTGTVWKIVAEVGARVAEGDTILIVESMKMEIPVCADSDGKLVSVLVSEGDAVADGQCVATVEK